MAARKCPMCFAVVPAGKVLAFSNDLECPGCARPLKIARASRHIAIFVGLVAGVFVWRFTRADSGALGWVLPIVYAYLAMSVVATLILIVTADLRLKSLDAGYAPAPSSAPPTAAHH
ncbi:MAG: hypothetical protein ACRD50_05685 [Candidatus Acidiferrales bacterium]